MMGDVVAGVLTRQWALLCLGLLIGIAPQMASAADCPGNPAALGTSRTLVVDVRRRAAAAQQQSDSANSRLGMHQGDLL
jgi:hypothetical protein